MALSQSFQVDVKSINCPFKDIKNNNDSTFQKWLQPLSGKMTIYGSIQCQQFYTQQKT